MNNNIVVSRQENIAVVKLNNPSKLNAITQDMLTGLIHAVEDLNSDINVKVVIFSAEGERAFSAGGNIKEEAAMGVLESEKWSRQGHKLTGLIENSRKPYIAAIFGHTAGAGCELAISCDFIIASEDAVISAPSINLGMLSGFGANIRLPKLVGKLKAQEMLMLGTAVTAQEAYRIGLVNNVVERENLMAEAFKCAEMLCEKSSAALALIKEAVSSSFDLAAEDAVAKEIELFVEAAKLEDKKEGMTAFLEKRKPNFIGR